MWELLQVSNMCNNDWLSELHNGQISLSSYFATVARKVARCVQFLRLLVFLEQLGLII